MLSRYLNLISLLQYIRICEDCFIYGITYTNALLSRILELIFFCQAGLRELVPMLRSILDDPRQAGMHRSAVRHFTGLQ